MRTSRMNESVLLVADLMQCDKRKNCSIVYDNDVHCTLYIIHIMIGQNQKLIADLSLIEISSK